MTPESSAPHPAHLHTRAQRGLVQAQQPDQHLETQPVYPR